MSELKSWLAANTPQTPAAPDDLEARIWQRLQAPDPKTLPLSKVAIAMLPIAAALLLAVGLLPTEPKTNDEMGSFLIQLSDEITSEDDALDYTDEIIDWAGI